jgi:hypothetical protein
MATVSQHSTLNEAPMMSRSFVAAAVLLASVSAASARDCVVTDPTGTRLNARNSPAGEVMATLENGSTVRLLGTRRDNSGKLWARVMPEGWKFDAWVFREFVSCP